MKYPPPRPRQHSRPGFSILETVIGLTVLTMALTLLAQFGVWCVGERAHSNNRQDALEHAANVLEEARALPWDALTPDWAAAQRLPAELDLRLIDGKETVTVEPEPSRPQTRRVTVEITWAKSRDHGARQVKLVALFSAREAGGKP
jgi:hypothetical protein